MYICIHIYVYIRAPCFAARDATGVAAWRGSCPDPTPNLPTKIIPTKIA